ncbi:hypothetical protein [Aquibacillus kalidii]|uniref:hypothetical protein n=1 Tax=Aquibacillus kalidii TaxID=2762597 RepID=UPI001645660B|nr:hypothetical protein [Aquibacillus kalidii]
MIKRISVLTLILIVFGMATVYFLNETTTAELKDTVKIREEQGDFIVHLRVEKVENKGYQILRSIEYQGKEPITIEHRTPLIAVSVNRSNAHFTGSPVTKTLNPGDIYHPQEPKNDEPLDRGEHMLYIHTQFVTDGETVDIKTNKPIVFE